MKLVTIQPKAVVECLTAAQPNRMFADPDLIDPDFKKAYDWMVKQMSKRIGPLRVPSTYPARPQFRGGYGLVECYPMWAWCPTPLLSAEDLTAHIEADDSFVIELEVPPSQVLLSCFDMWHHVLNDHDLNLYEGEVVDRQKSWERIFSVDPASGKYTLDSPDRSYMTLDEPVYVQACMWYISSGWVKSFKPHVQKETSYDL